MSELVELQCERRWLATSALLFRWPRTAIAGFDKRVICITLIWTSLLCHRPRGMLICSLRDHARRFALWSAPSWAAPAARPKCKCGADVRTGSRIFGSKLSEQQNLDTYCALHAPTCLSLVSADDSLPNDPQNGAWLSKRWWPHCLDGRCILGPRPHIDAGA